jgi:hypothetical protein
MISTVSITDATDAFICCEIGAFVGFENRPQKLISRGFLVSIVFLVKENLAFCTDIAELILEI